MGRGVAVAVGIVGLIAVAAIVGVVAVGAGGRDPGAIESGVAARDEARRFAMERQVAARVDAWHIRQGSYPGSLNDLEEVPALPEGYAWEYDPGTGRARIVGE